jgi:rfaE bifunctional protein kinase chain/domain
MNLSSIIDSWKSKNVLVIGDVMIDAYYYGTSTRMSPEAPVPILDLTKKEKRLGGAANVALNIAKLGAHSILIGGIGDDENGKLMLSLCSDEKISTKFTKIQNRPTTVKTRIIGNNQHLLRIDDEDTSNIPDDYEIVVLGWFDAFFESVDVIILQDYNKGFLTPKIIQRTIEKANQLDIPVIVDPKKEHFFNYKNCTLFKPNRKEMLEALGQENSKNIDFFESAEELRQKLKAKIVMTTLSEDGAILVSENERLKQDAHERNILDVSGAGDSVLSIAALCLASKCNYEEILYLSNLAGGLVCEHVGVHPLTKEMILSEID